MEKKKWGATLFGYLRPYRPELTVRDDELFKAYYCGVCAALGKRSMVCRAMLRFDIAFLSIVRDAFGDGPHQLAPAFCPTKLKRLPVVQGPCMPFAAQVHLLLAEEKRRDDRRDGSKFSGMGLFRRQIERATAEQGELYQALLAMDEAQLSLEQENCTDVDLAAEPFSVFVGRLLAHGMDEERQEGLSWMGRNIGRWIYWLDALDDIAADQKSGNYNVFVKNGMDKQSAHQYIAPLLALCESQAFAAWNTLDFSRNGSIVRNVLLYGMPQAVAEVMNERQAGDGSI